MKSIAWAADERTLHRWDGLVALWVTIWLIVGAAVGYQIWQLTGLSRSTVESGQALQNAAEALKGLARIPLIGTRTGEIGDQVAATAANIIVSGQQAGSSIRGLSLLIGLAVAVIPAGSMLAVYLPLRTARSRDTAYIRDILSEQGLTPPLQAYLARRAVATLPASDLLDASSDPHGDLQSGKFRALALAELARLGITVSGTA